MSIRFKIFKIVLLILSLGFPQVYAADPLVNTGVLLKQLKKLEKCRKCPVSEIKNFNESKVINISGVPGYSKGISTKIRAQMFVADAYSESTTVQVYGLPAIIYFPDNPNKSPLRISMITVDVHEQIHEKVLDSKEVGVPYGALNGKKSKYIVYGQTVLKNTKTELNYKDGRFEMESEVDISNMNDKDGRKYFDNFQGLVTSLNQELDKMNNVHYRKWQEEEAKRILKKRKQLSKQVHTNITDPSVFVALFNYNVSFANLKKESEKTELGHFAYDDSEAHKKYNVGVELINYGSYYDMLYSVAYDEAIDDDEAKLKAMIDKMNEKLGGKIPPGAQSASAQETNYKGIVDVVVRYDISQGVKGSTMAKNDEGFAKFTKKTYGKLQKIADKTK